MELVSRSGGTLEARTGVALLSLVFFFVVHAAGVRWFGRTQVAMMALLGVSLGVLILPGLFAIHPANYRPFFRGGASGFLAALPPLFFAYAGFESLAQTAGETAGSRARLPGVFLKGIASTALIYVLLSAVAFGVLPGARLQSSTAPMAEVGARYLPVGAAWFVTLGAVMALTTSINATMLVPSRLALVLVRDGLAPSWLGRVSARTGTPVLGLLGTLVVSSALLLSGQVALTLNIAVIALVALYLIHSVALLALPRRNPALYASAASGVSRSWQVAAAWISIVSMAALIVLQFSADVHQVLTSSFHERVASRSLTSLELLAAWAAVGAVLYLLARRHAEG